VPPRPTPSCGSSDRWGVGTVAGTEAALEPPRDGEGPVHATTAAASTKTAVRCAPRVAPPCTSLVTRRDLREVLHLGEPGSADDETTEHTEEGWSIAGRSTAVSLDS